MHQDGSLPRARRDGLLEETVGEELLLYDQNSHTAHCLSPIAACVWRHCDGERDMSELAELAGASKDSVADALHELREKDLLAAEPQLTQSTVPGISRREAIGRVARYGAAATAGSLIVSATAATPAMAASMEECCSCIDSSQQPCKCLRKVWASESACNTWCQSNEGGKTCESGGLHGNQTCSNNQCVT
jgi:hypothetical protein